MATDERSGVSDFDPSNEETRAAVAALLERAESASDHPPLAEPSRLAWAGAAGDFLGLVLRTDGAVAGYAQLGWRDRSFTVEIALDPERPDSAATRRALLEAAASTAAHHGATELRYWANRHDPDDDGIEALGFRTERDLLQMRVPLPLDVDRRPIDAGFTFRPFRPGQDEAAWLEVNNRAFATHPEQGGWDVATLEAREKTSWFDPDGFVLCEAGGTLAGSCWTKVHADHQPPLGEIYVISVDPAFQQRGLGRALALAGLDWLARRVAVGMLYVEKTNRGAVELYRSLGFTIDHVDRCYLLEGPGGRANG